MLRWFALCTSVIVLMAGCMSPGASNPGHQVTAASYKTDATKGLVVLSALWGRSWKCGTFEH